MLFLWSFAEKSSSNTFLISCFHILYFYIISMWLSIIMIDYQLPCRKLNGRIYFIFLIISSSFNFLLDKWPRRLETLFHNTHHSKHHILYILFFWVNNTQIYLSYKKNPYSKIHCTFFIISHCIITINLYYPYFPPISNFSIRIVNPENFLSIFQLNCNIIVTISWYIKNIKSFPRCFII